MRTADRIGSGLESSRQPAMRSSSQLAPAGTFIAAALGSRRSFAALSRYLPRYRAILLQDFPRTTAKGRAFMTVRYTPGPMQDAIGISQEIYRHWKAVAGILAADYADHMGVRT